MKKIKLSPKGITIVDDSDYNKLSKHKWYLSSGYAINENREKMHRLIIQPKTNEIVDHIDRDKLNNTRSNLRIVTHRQNAHNSSKRKNTKNNYKGVNYVEKIGLYQSRCRINGKDYFLGHFKTEIAAAHAYNLKASELSYYCCLNDLTEYNLDYLYDILKSHRVKVKKHKGSKYKYIGFKKKSGRMACDKFLIRFTHEGKRYYKGYFNNEQDAVDYLIDNFSDILHDAGALKQQ